MPSAPLSRFRRPLVLGASAAAVAASLGAGWVAPEPAPTPVPVRAVAAPKPVVPVFTPSDISIPAIGLVSAPTVPVGTEPDGTMGSPKTARDVAWHAYAEAGEGNALFASHRDWNGELGSFNRLAEVEAGDEVIVSGEGESLTFRVTWVEQMDGDVDATELLGPQDEPVVTLITCAGPFDRVYRRSQDRVVVRAVLAA